ncbi:hypothetical protein RCO27_02330 [Sphingosinicella sp. LHD-64]|uniref:hypothetical protein n=1 Tax=Sphingosinicella sp. LHD-64 TaxID=3072139 RepID=UPI00280DC1AD|nr:hypothetical protein [Sphingosinicella sp. LHD-64]MDQ8755055.1 hypothetical protein [Sphingosinicella sp. LHD-64]
MFEQGESARKRGSVTVLALLVGLLLGLSGSGVQPQSDPNTARLGNGKILRLATGLRIAGRPDDNGTNDEASPALPPPPPTVVTELVSVRPAARVAQTAFAAASLDPQFHYQARAPPAA